MLIFNKELGVSPLTTHIPISKVQQKIKEKSLLIKLRKLMIFTKKY